MGFSGKPSKGCAPCRAKRTKCDLALPSCTQCIRKNRMCTGYRNEQDLLFRNETKLVVRKANRRHEDAAEGSASPDSLLLRTMQIHRPSRIASVDDEAINHFFAEYNYVFFPAEGPNLSTNGIDCISPIFQQDMNSGGPMAETVVACGLAALGNLHGSQELLMTAKAKQVKVLGQLTEQLKDPKNATSDSSILTCVTLGIFENILCDASSEAQAMHHYKGASALAQLRGPSAFTSRVSQAIYAKMRAFILAHCLQAREPLPNFIMASLNNESFLERDFDPLFYTLFAELCQLRADHKNKGFVDANMARHARRIVKELGGWQPRTVPEWRRDQRPMPEPDGHCSMANMDRFVWLAHGWMFNRSACILASDMIIEWARAQYNLSLSSADSKVLDDATQAQIKTCEMLSGDIEYYLDLFASMRPKVKAIHGNGLLWPLYILTMASTNTPETLFWIQQNADRVASVFSLRQAKVITDFLCLYLARYASQYPMDILAQ